MRAHKTWTSAVSAQSVDHLILFPGVATRDWLNWLFPSTAVQQSCFSFFQDVELRLHLRQHQLIELSCADTVCDRCAKLRMSRIRRIEVTQTG